MPSGLVSGLAQEMFNVNIFFAVTVRTPTTQRSTRDFIVSWLTPWLARPMERELLQLEEEEELLVVEELVLMVTSLTWL